MDFIQSKTKPKPMRRSLTLSSLMPYEITSRREFTKRKHGTARKSDRHDASPRESVIRNILNYSLALKVFDTEDVGTINMVMN